MIAIGVGVSRIRDYWHFQASVRNFDSNGETQLQGVLSASGAFGVLACPLWYTCRGSEGHASHSRHPARKRKKLLSACVLRAQMAGGGVTPVLNRVVYFLPPLDWTALLMISC